MDDDALLTYRQAREELGWSKVKMARVMKRLVESGAVTVYENPADHREKLIRRSELQQALRPQPQ